MTSTVTVVPAAFTDPGEMPEVHTDNRRTITEKVTAADGGKLDRVTRIEVLEDEAVLGNHYHGFAEKFSGVGGGTLLTADAGDPNVALHVLPPEGWEVTIPAGVIHTFIMNVGAVLVSRTDRHFVSERDKDKHPGEPVNTHAVTLY